MIESKVKAGTVAAPVALLVAYFLGKVPFLADMPEQVAVSLQALVVAAVTFAAGYATKHTLRPDLSYEPKHSAEEGYSAVELAVGVLLILILVFVLLTVAKDAL